VKDLKRSRVIEVSPDITMIEGYISDNFFFKPPSCNCFVLRDGELVLLVDTGTYPFYRDTILDVLRRHRRDGASRLVLMLTQGHFDHVANNDVILEAGYGDVRFLLPDAEVPTIDLYHHWMGDFAAMTEYYDPYREFPMVFPTAPINLASRVSTPLAVGLLSSSLKALFRGIKTLAGQAEILRTQDREEWKFGDVTLQGWEIGRFLAIHDATHSPGHLSFYDPRDKVLLTGDATLEINPAFFDSSLETCIKVMGDFKRFAEQGHVEVATDAHRSSIWAEELAYAFDYQPVHPIQTIDVARGVEECVTFLGFYGDYYAAIEREMLGALSRLGEATVPELVEEFRATTDTYARFKTKLVFPRLPSRLDVTAANILKESGIVRRREGERIVFSSAGLAPAGS
jgi:glyoxylase-like metal-dependent hydrolase (beta-lactamase superfamily II)